MPLDMSAILEANAGHREQNTVMAELESAGRSYAAGFGHIGGMLGIQRARDWAREQERLAEEASARSSMTQRFSDIDGPGSALSYVGHLGLQALPYFAEAATGAGLGTIAARRAGIAAGTAAARITAGTGGVVASYPSSVGAIASAQDDQAGQYDPGTAAAMGAPYAALNAFGMEGALARRLGGGVARPGGFGRRVAVGAAEGAAGEGLVNEFGQQVIEETARGGVDPNHSLSSPEARERLFESAMGGVTLGGVLGGAGRVRSGRRQEAINPDAPTDLVDSSTPNGPSTQPSNWPDPRAELGGADIYQRGQDASLGDVVQPGAMPARTPVTGAPAPVDTRYADMAGPAPAGSGFISPPADYGMPARAFNPDGLHPGAPGVSPAASQQDVNELRDMLDRARGPTMADPNAPQVDLGGMSSPTNTMRSTDQGVSRFGKPLDAMQAMRAQFDPEKLTDATMRRKAGQISEVAVQQAMRGASPALKNDAWVTAIALQVRQALANNDPAKAAQAIAKADQQLQTAKIAPATIQARQAGLAKAQELVDAHLRLTDQTRQQLAAMAPGIQQQEQQELQAQQAAQAQQAQAQAQQEAQVKQRAAAPQMQADQGLAAAKVAVTQAKTLKARAMALRIQREAQEVAAPKPAPEAKPTPAPKQARAPKPKPAPAAPAAAPAPKPNLGAQQKAARAAKLREVAERLRNRTQAPSPEQQKERAAKEREAKVDQETRQERTADEPQGASAEDPTRIERAKRVEAAGEQIARLLERKLISQEVAKIGHAQLDKGLAEGNDTVIAQVERGIEQKLEQVKAARDKVREAKAEPAASKSELSPEPAKAERKPVVVEKRKLGPKAKPQTRLATTNGVTHVSAGRIREIVADHAGGMTSPRIEVVNSTEELPEHLRELAIEATGWHDPETGTVYLVAQNLATEGEVTATLFHEVAGHAGLRRQLGEKLREVLQRIYDTNKAVRRLADDYLRSNPNQYAGAEQQSYATEEVLAGFMEAGRPMAGPIQMLKGAVLSFARRIGLTKGGYSNAEVMYIARKAFDAGMAGGPQGPGGGRAQTRLKVPTKEQATNIVQDWNTNLRDRARGWKLGAQFVGNIVEDWKDRLPSLKRWYDSAMEMAAETRHHEEGVAKIAQRLRASKETALNSLLPDVSFHDMNPDPQAPANERPNTSTMTPEQRTAFVDLQKRFNALSPEGKALYREATDYFRTQYAEMQNRLKQVVANSKLDPKDQRLAEKLISEQFGRVKTYFPLMRFGEHIVVARTQELTNSLAEVRAAGDRMRSALDSGDATAAATARKEMEAAQAKADGLKADGYRLEKFDTLSEAKRRMAELEGQGMKVTLTREDDYEPQLTGMSATMLGKIDEAIRTTVSDGEMANDLSRMVYQLYAQAMPERSALKATLQRNNVEGYVRDNAARVFATAGRRTAFRLSRLGFAEQSRQALDDLRREAEAGTDNSQTKQVYNQIMRHMKASLSYKETPIQDLLGNVSYLWLLGLTPSFAIMNTLQTPMVAMPMMMARYGVTKAGSALARAAAQVAQHQTTKTADKARAEVDLDTVTDNKDEQRMLHRLKDLGIIDITMEHDLGAIASGQNRVLDVMTRVAGWLPKYTEQFNRVATALATYRLAREKGDAHDVAVEAARKLVDNSHFNYNAENAPYVMRPGVVPWGKLIFQFRKYQFGMIRAINKNFADSFLNKDVSKEDRAIARRTLFGLMATHGAMAGTMGLPGMTLVFFVMKALSSMFGDDDEPWDPQAAYRQFLADALGGALGQDAGKAAAEVVARGVPRVFGADLSNRLGLGELYTPVRTRESGSEGRAAWNEYVAAALGPLMSIGGDYAEAVKRMGDGQTMQGVELMMPKAIRDAVRSARFATSGVETSRGNTTLPADEITWPMVATQVLGFTPAGVAEHYEGSRAIRNAQKFLQDRRSELLREVATATIAGDEAAIREARAEINRYNEVRRSHGEQTINGISIARAIQERRANGRNTVNGVILDRRERALGRFGDFANR